MNRVRGFFTVLLVAGLVGSGIAYHLNTVKEYEKYLTIATNTATAFSKTATLENLTLATENAQLEAGAEELLVITKRAFIICDTLATSGVQSYRQVEVTLARVEELQAEAASTNGMEVEAEELQGVVDMLRATRNTLREGFIDELNIDDAPPPPPLPEDDRVTAVPDDDLYAGRYHTRKRTSRFFSRAKRTG